MTALIFGALVGGLAGSPHCLGMCGGFASAAAEHRLAYNLGRLCTYTTLGLLAGAAGGAIPGPGWVSSALALVLLGWFSLRLAGLVKGPKVGSKWLVRLGGKQLKRPGWVGRAGLGAVTALLPCGLVWAAMGLAVTAGTALGGAIVMAAFWVGTVPMLWGAAAGIRWIGARGQGARSVLALCVFVAGVWSIAQRGVQVEAGEPPHCHEVP